MKSYRLGTAFGLAVAARPTAVFASLGLWALLSLGAAALLRLPAAQAVVGGLLATLLHWLGELWHQLGHARAARQTGYPMSGVLFHWLIGLSQYPADEPPLPAEVHIRRALGGPKANLLLAVPVGLLAWLLPGGRLPFYLALLFFLENAFVFGLGAFLPLGFTDGSTLLRWHKKS